jgi:hypothetical protein
MEQKPNLLAQIAQQENSATMVPTCFVKNVKVVNLPRTAGPKRVQTAWIKKEESFTRTLRDLLHANNAQLDIGL